MKNLAVILLGLVLLAGCATGGMEVNVNGLPAPTNIMIGGQGTDFQYFMVVTRYFDVPEGSEKRQTFEYVPFDEPVKLKENTKSVVVTMRILNSKKLSYSLHEVVEQTYDTDKFPYLTTHQTYAGSLSYQEFARVLPLNMEKSGVFKVEMRDASGKVIITLGPVIYRRVEGGGLAKDRY